jgi:hypothetical protein
MTAISKFPHLINMLDFDDHAVPCLAIVDLSILGDFVRSSDSRKSLWPAECTAWYL